MGDEASVGCVVAVTAVVMQSVPLQTLGGTSISGGEVFSTATEVTARANKQRSNA